MPWTLSGSSATSDVMSRSLPLTRMRSHPCSSARRSISTATVARSRECTASCLRSRRGVICRAFGPLSATAPVRWRGVGAAVDSAVMRATRWLSPRRQSSRSAAWAERRTTPAGRPRSSSSSRGWMNGLESSTTRLGSRSCVENVVTSERPSGAKRARPRPGAPASTSRSSVGRDAPDQARHGVSDLGRAVGRQPALEIGQAVLDLDRARPRTLSVHVDRQDPERVARAYELQQQIVVEVCGGQLPFDHDSSFPRSAVRRPRSQLLSLRLPCLCPAANRAAHASGGRRDPISCVH